MFGLRFWRRAIGAFGAAGPRKVKVRRLGVESLEDRSLLSISGGSLISQTSLVSNGIFGPAHRGARPFRPSSQMPLIILGRDRPSQLQRSSANY